AFESDEVFSNAKSIAGFWATFDGIIQFIISNSGSYRKNKIVIDTIKAINLLREFRKELTQKSLRFIATARLMGVTLTCKSYQLPDSILLYSLSKKERNERQPALEFYSSSAWEYQQLPYHPVELSVSITIPVDQTQDSAFFKVKDEAKSFAIQRFNKVIESILVAKSGDTKLSAINLSGSIEYIPTSRSLSQTMPPNVNITLRKNDIKKIASAYNLVSGGKLSDKTLSRSLHRFLLGRKRTNLVDKLIDYVIAWESLLLTQDGNPIAQELTYRFTLNGATLISSANKKTNTIEVYKKMKSAYSTRSTIVHGGSKNEIIKKLKIGGYNSEKELCDYLESNYRKVIYWLIELKPRERPYKKKDGWENLMWSSH
ncbi:hypothetical protein ACFL50_06505, partial [Candidatus Latescibacterota bacterium]